jgi:hypothetical protein
MITSAQLLLESPGRLETDCQALAAGLSALSPRVPWFGFYEKNLFRGRVPLSTGTLVGGTVPVVHMALRQLGLTPPWPLDYPDCLRRFFRRCVWPSTWREVCGRAPLFVKPRGRVKKFTGFVTGTPTLARIRPDDEIWCSDVVDFKSEWRAFVLLGRVLDVRHYWGDEATPVDRGVVEDAAYAYFAAGGPVAFLLDFGVLRGGSITALIEANDAYACGAYGVKPSVYAVVLAVRWVEIAQGLKAAMEACAALTASGFS